MEQGQVAPEGVITPSSSPLKKLSKKAAAVVASTALAVSSCAQTATETSKVSEKKVSTVALNLNSLSLEEYEQKVQAMSEEQLDTEFARLSVFTGDKSLPLKERKFYGKFKVVCTDEIQNRTAKLKIQSEKLKAENAATAKRIAEKQEFIQALNSLKK